MMFATGIDFRFPRVEQGIFLALPADKTSFINGDGVGDCGIQSRFMLIGAKSLKIPISGPSLGSVEFFLSTRTLSESPRDCEWINGIIDAVISRRGCPCGWPCRDR